LLEADADGPCWSDAEIAGAFDCRTKTVENIRERFVTEGSEIALTGKPKSRVRAKVLSGDQEEEGKRAITDISSAGPEESQVTARNSSQTDAMYHVSDAVRVASEG
jgi:hypothetical protein